MNEEASESLLRYVDILIRRKWLFLVPLVLSAFGATFYAMSLPPVYRSETTILVEPQRVPADYVRSTVTGSVKDRLSVISQQILSRTKLESIILEYNLYPDMRKQGSMEGVVRHMRRNIEVDVMEGARYGGSREAAAAAFKLAFLHRDPVVAQSVAVRLASMYIEENLRLREDLARGATEFLEKQLEEMEQELKKREEALRVFKEQYMGELPEQLAANLHTIEQLQQQRTSVQTALRDAENRQVSLEQQLADTPRYLMGEQSDRQDLYRQLAAKRQLLTELRARYNDLYPDVIRLQDEIREITGKISAAEEPGSTSADRTPLVDPAYARLKAQVDAGALQIYSLRRESDKLNQRMADLQQRVENAPKREQELMSLVRDYDTIKQNYDSLMERKLSAGIAENLETRQKSEQFHVLDPANLPHSPVKPERLKIVAMGVLLGLGIGGALSVAVEYLRRAYRTVEEVKSSLSLPVLAVIPKLVTDQEVAQTRKRRITVALLCLLLLAASAAVLVFYAKEADVWSRLK